MSRNAEELSWGMIARNRWAIGVTVFLSGGVGALQAQVLSHAQQLYDQSASIAELKKSDEAEFKKVKEAVAAVEVKVARIDERTLLILEAVNQNSRRGNRDEDNRPD